MISLFLIKGITTKVVFQDCYWFATNLLQVGKCRKGLVSSIYLLKVKKWLPDPCEKKPCSLLPPLQRHLNDLILTIFVTKH
jgi:hypothetical protein